MVSLTCLTTVWLSKGPTGSHVFYCLVGLLGLVHLVVSGLGGRERDRVCGQNMSQCQPGRGGEIGYLLTGGAAGQRSEGRGQRKK